MTQCFDDALNDLCRDEMTAAAMAGDHDRAVRATVAQIGMLAIALNARAAREDSTLEALTLGSIQLLMEMVEDAADIIDEHQVAAEGMRQ